MELRSKDHRLCLVQVLNHTRTPSFPVLEGEPPRKPQQTDSTWLRRSSALVGPPASGGYIDCIIYGETIALFSLRRGNGIQRTLVTSARRVFSN